MIKIIKENIYSRLLLLVSGLLLSSAIVYGMDDFDVDSFINPSFFDEGGMVSFPAQIGGFVQPGEQQAALHFALPAQPQEQVMQDQQEDQEEHVAVGSIESRRGKQYPCPNCGKVFKYQSLLNRHTDTHTKPHSCQECGKGFGQQAHLIDHIRTHTGEKPYKCEKCDRSFSQNSNLTAHMRIHAGEKPYNCKRCGRKFIRKSDCKTHMKTHFVPPAQLQEPAQEDRGEKEVARSTARASDIICQLSCCGKTFSKRWMLKRHMGTHTGERPFTCEICDRSFSQRGNRNRHMKKHSNPMIMHEEEQKSGYEGGYL